MAAHGDWNRAIIEEFHANGGAVKGFGRSLVILHHRGAKSGASHETPVMALHPDADTWLVAASAAGAPRNPAWYHNLLAHSDAAIETPDESSVPVRVEELTGQARDEEWAKFTAAAPGFADYQSKTTRTIPLLVLHRADR